MVVVVLLLLLLLLVVVAVVAEGDHRRAILCSIHQGSGTHPGAPPHATEMQANCSTVDRYFKRSEGLSMDGWMDGWMEGRMEKEINKSALSSRESYERRVGGCEGDVQKRQTMRTSCSGPLVRACSGTCVRGLSERVGGWYQGVVDVQLFLPVEKSE